MTKQAITKKKLSELTGLTFREISKRCEELGIYSRIITKTKTLIYDFSLQDVGRILLYNSLKLPEKIIIKEIYHIYESKLNTQKNE